MNSQPENFDFDVFLSHSSKDKLVVREIAQRLKKDGIKVWFDEWEIKLGDSIPTKIEEGLEHSRVLVLCMSANAFGSDWAQLESGTFRFRDPLNKLRRFVPLRLDGAPVKGSLAQFRYLDWATNNENTYQEFREVCLGPVQDRVSPSHAREPHALDDLARITKARRAEWKRMLRDFETEASRYHDLSLSLFHVASNEPPGKRKFRQPNHVINLWQYYGPTPTKETVLNLVKTERFTKFGVTGAELSVFGVLEGEKTSLFKNMAIRAATLLPRETNALITAQVADNCRDLLGIEKTDSKPLFVSNSNSLARWISLLLVSTLASHPERLQNDRLAVDAFTGSLTIFDYFDLDEKATKQ